MSLNYRLNFSSTLYKGVICVTYVVFVGLQRPLQRDGQLLVDLMNCCLDFHLDAPLSCFYTILLKKNTYPQVRYVADR